ncbi:putative RNA polymerase II subunit B1 CTD phosphatase RPAP2 [Battus philenor]|uniref:putative RNA polymerase II subunit B1 CTD phosphatase RPAP2 n=1 Tax=Battus philenor TaxID=42288 RepID=UPI0035CFAB3C
MEETKVIKKKKPTKIEEMTREQIRQAIIKKQECNAKAQKIVESLLEKSISETYFMQCLPEINQCHFEDIIEERCIIKQCGYPLCENHLHEKDIPKQKYRISIKNNKVYDITARKSFCSNSCYKSAMHIKKQLLTSPLWFREYEEMPQFHLLPLNTNGSLGQEVDLGVVERVKMGSEKPTFTSVNDFANASLTEFGNDGNKHTEDILNNISKLNNVNSNSDKDTDIKNKAIESSNIKDTPEKFKMQENKDLINEDCSQQKKNGTGLKSKSNRSIPNPLNIVGEIIEKPEKPIDPILINSPQNISVKKDLTTIKKVPQRKQPSVTTITIEVEKCLAEWFTIDTLIFIFGEQRVKEMVTDKGECIKEYLNNYAQSIFYNSNSYDQYQALCRKLNMLELEDRKYDAQTLQRETKPLPDYSVLQEESKKIQLKVKAFLSGDTEIITVDENATDNTTPTESTEDRPTQLPLVDKNAQNALRRRIVCQHLNKVLPDLLQSLNLSTMTISSDVRLLVNTFKLKANNIMFKSIQWNLIAIIFIKLLSLRNQRLQCLLEQPTAFQHLQLLLLSYKQDGGYLDRLISWLTDIDRLLDVNDTQLTIET